jgi:hypothetical protein
MVDTPSPWIDAYRTESPVNMQWQDYTAAQANFQALRAAENILFAPLRAPYNQIPEQVEAGRVNLNTISERNVVHGLIANLLPPSDVDVAPYGSVDIDHNGNGVVDLGERTAILPGGQVQQIASFIERSRRGYWSVVGQPGDPFVRFYDPAPGTDLFNPHFPTRFAGVFRPQSEAGMVAKTRNPFPQSYNPVPASGDPRFPAHIENRRLYDLANKKGVLDLYAQLNPAHVTLLRGGPEVAATGDADNDSNPDSAGVVKPGSVPLFLPTVKQLENATQRSPMKDFYPMTRLEKLTTNRSNVFAVWVTVGFFEIDPVTGQLGIEYGADSGQAERYRAFYVIDRSRPVGFQVGEDHNIEKSILVRRYLNTDE